MARNASDTARSTYLVIDDGGAQRDVPLEALQDRIRALDGDPRVVGYDVHAGFNVPDLAALASILRASDRQFQIEPTIIDERETSGKKPFSPTQVYVEVAGKPLRRRIASERDQSRYASQLPVNADQVEAAFGLFHRGLYRDRISPVLEEVRARNPRTLGDYLLELHQVILRRQLALSNVTIRAMRFDRCDPASGSVRHGVEVHREHRFIYIGLSKEGIEEGFTEHLLDVFRDARAAKCAVSFIATPLHPQPYFRA
jgi:hypothetical protein